MSSKMAKVTNKAGVDADKAIKDAVDKYKKQVEKDQSLSIEQASMFVEGEAKRNITKYKSQENKLIDTGRMVNSITHKVEIRKGKFVGVVGSNVDYYKYQELGTSTIPARPTLRPALYDNIKRVVKIARNGLNQSAKKVSK